MYSCNYIIGDMRNEKYFYDHYKKSEYNHEYIKLMKYSYIYISMYTKYKYNFKKMALGERRSRESP